MSFLRTLAFSRLKRPPILTQGQTSTVKYPEGLFFSSWYRERYCRDLPETVDFAWHFSNIGWRKNFNPSPIFDIEKYKHRYFSNKSKSGEEQDPLLNLIKRFEEGRNTNLNSPGLRHAITSLGLSKYLQPEKVNLLQLCWIGKLLNTLDEEGIRAYKVILCSELFDEDWYRAKYRICNEHDPLLHYLTGNNARSNWPNPLFDPVWYGYQFKGKLSKSRFPLVHYIRGGAEQEIEPSGLYEPEVFRSRISNANADAIKQLKNAISICKLDQEMKFSTDRKRLMQKALDSGVFDSSWYVEEYFRSNAAPYWPLKHYFEIGEGRGFLPNKHFDPEWYKETYMDAAAAIGKECPFEHYLEIGIDSNFLPSSLPYLDSDVGKVHVLNKSVAFPESRSTHQFSEKRRQAERVRASGLFDEEYYCQHHHAVRKSVLNPLEHYLERGEFKGFMPNAYFDPYWYRARLHERNIQIPDATPLLFHYLSAGRFLGVDPSAYFSSDQYLKENEGDIEKCDALLHFFHTKNEANKAPPRKTVAVLMDEISKTGLFLSDWYTNVYEDLRGSGVDALEHYAVFGGKEDRNPNPYFDAGWYQKKYPHVNEKNVNPLVHYYKHGWRNGLDPSIKFSTKKYLEKYPEVAELRVCPLRYFLEKGKALGHQSFSLNRQSDIAIVPPYLSNEIPVVEGALLPVDKSLRGITQYKKATLNPKSNSFNPDRLNVHWVIPDFSPGGGGHMTIFRMVHFLGLYGHSQVLWIETPTLHSDEQSAQDDILKHFQHVDVTVKILGKDGLSKASGDVVIATAWSTVWPALTAVDFKRIFYFVQDYEPSFYPCGSASYLAENTYKEDLDCICAGPWLESLMREGYGRWATSFSLCADRSVYKMLPYKRSNQIVSLAFYARTFTSRRLVELGMMALEILAERGHQFSVDFFGAELKLDEAPFPTRLRGVLSTGELAELYQDADIGVVFSGTNYSLIPQEMMACGLPIVEVKTVCTDLVFPAMTVSTAEPDPRDIADKIEKLIVSEELRAIQARAGYEWVSSLEWDSSARVVERSLINRLSEVGYLAKSDQMIKGPLATVVIPVFNGGELLKKVIQKVMEQRAPWKFELLILDSESTDDIASYVSKHPGIRYERIRKTDFQHGATRNRGVDLANGEYVAFLTQDAVPVNDTWLFSLVTSLTRDDNVAGVFGRHIAHSDASGFTKRMLNKHFSGFEEFPLVLSKYTNSKKWESGDVGWRRVLHFYSDNNSCLRKSVWKKYPYPQIDFGEDQAWADIIIKAGYSKAYAPTAVVAHSHDFDPAEQRIRSAEESHFFKRWFGYDLVSDTENLENLIDSLNRHDEALASNLRCSPEELEKQKENNRQRVYGYRDGLASALRHLHIKTA